MIKTAGGMLVRNTPIEYYKDCGLWVKREDLACPPPGPPFSKTRGVYAWVRKQNNDLIGVLDTYHSQGGWAVARACQILGKRCVDFYPAYKHQPEERDPQKQAAALGAEVIGLPAGRSAILYHQAKKLIAQRGGIMIPNALKLEESVIETAREVPKQKFDSVLVSASSGTIAAGVIKGFHEHKLCSPTFIIHLGYHRSNTQVTRYLQDMSGVSSFDAVLVDELYSYKDACKTENIPPWPCSEYYDLKAYDWWMRHRQTKLGRVLFWNIG